MKTRIIIILALLLPISVFASMSGQIDDNYIVEIDIQKGWNIVAGIMPGEAILSDSDIQKEDISVVWYYSPIQKEYFQIYPNLEMDALSDDDDFVLTSAFWIYSNKSGTLRYDTLEDYPSLSDRKLYKGYNFVTITPNMINEAEEDISTRDLFGGCDVSRAYVFDGDSASSERYWLEFNVDEDGLDQSGMAGYGFLVKVNGDCYIDGPNSSASTPPSLPN